MDFRISFGAGEAKMMIWLKGKKFFFKYFKNINFVKCVNIHSSLVQQATPLEQLFVLIYFIESQD